MSGFVSAADAARATAEMPWAAREVPRTLHDFLAAAAKAHGERPAVSFQLTSAPDARATTWSWHELHARTCQVANLLRRLGIGEGDVVAVVLPNAPETVATLLGAAIAGIVAPINPLQGAAHLAETLNGIGARVVVTLKAFPRTAIAQTVAQAVARAPGVTTVLEVDLGRHLPAARRLLLPLVRPRQPVRHHARVLDFTRACAAEPRRLGFADAAGDRVAALFHTGGTTGHPKLVAHRYSGMIYNGWLGAWAVFRPEDVLICPLPLFHVFAAYPVLMSAIASGAHLVLPTPAGYRGEGVLDNFWKLIARWHVSFLITVPTALSALMQRPVDADVSSLKTAISGSAPLPVELYQRFQAATGVEVAEGYGLTEAACLVSCNPIHGPKKVGSVGIPFPYCAVRICALDSDSDMPPGEIGEICLRSPGVDASTSGLRPGPQGAAAPGRWLRSGDLGRLDADGYLWITGRARDLIIRGGHNIDPAVIEEALMAHPSVAFAGAVGQPDAHAGEIPCAYVELVAGATVPAETLLAFARARIDERAARPRHVEILTHLPKTAVGKVRKTELRQLAIIRIYDDVLGPLGVHVREVVDDPRRGLTARLEGDGDARRPEAEALLAAFTVPWEWA